MSQVRIGVTVLVLGVLLAYPIACTLDNAEAPPLSGPSEFATSINMRANPDTLIADGFSSAVIEAVVRDENGQAAPGRTINFDILQPPGAGQFQGTGVFLDFGNIAPINGPRPLAGGTEATLVQDVTDSSGVARARYWAPFRTDLGNDSTVTVTAREQGTNVRNDLVRSVDIFLRAADRPQFVNGTCAGTGPSGISVEPQDSVHRVNDLIFFTATGTAIPGMPNDPVARYEWEFGDQSPPEEGRNVVHAYTAPGNYTVTLTTTLAISGQQDFCSVIVVVSATGF